MILRIRLQELVIYLRHEEINVPSMPDKVFKIADVPVSNETFFEGMQLLTNMPFAPIVIKWGFHGAVAFLQQHLIDDVMLDNAVTWLPINSSASSTDLFEAFIHDEELPMKGSAAIIVER